MTVVTEAPVAVPVYVFRQPSGFAILLQALGSLALRIALALPFFLLGLKHWDGFLKLPSATLDLYQNPPTFFGKVYAVPYPEYFAWAGSLAEILLPAALVIGFATRLSAFGILCMTAVIYSISPHSWASEALPWAAMALALVAYGPGRISFDWFIWQGFRRS